MTFAAKHSPIWAIFDSVDEPELGPGPRLGVWPAAQVEARLSAVSEGASGPCMTNLTVIRALLLLWHDHHEPAHELVQGFGQGPGAFVHGILHRREPDYGNAGYWFRRVGRPSVFADLAVKAIPLAVDPALQKRLFGRGGEWDPFGFIDACEAATSGRQSDWVAPLRRVQGLESRLLLAWLLEGAQGE